LFKNSNHLKHPKMSEPLNTLISLIPLKKTKITRITHKYYSGEYILHYRSEPVMRMIKTDNC
jgi:hypothetical protein